MSKVLTAGTSPAKRGPAKGTPKTEAHKQAIREGHLRRKLDKALQDKISAQLGVENDD